MNVYICTYNLSKLSVGLKLFDAFSPESVQQEQSQEPVATDKTGRFTYLCKM